MGNKKHQQEKSTAIYRAVIVLFVVFLVGAFAVGKLKTGEDQALESADPKVLALAECLTEKGVKMYGAEWCSHCQKQKKIFGTAFERVDYVECTVAGNPRAQARECSDAGVESYPTWIFADGSRETGQRSFEDLAFRGGCEWTD
jgi:glutaredoxin